jgi:hypothetical protein
VDDGNPVREKFTRVALLDTLNEDVKSQETFGCSTSTSINNHTKFRNTIASQNASFRSPNMEEHAESKGYAVRLSLRRNRDTLQLIHNSHGMAWGLFDKDGVRDEIGTINLLTPEVVVKAREEIQTGKSISLNWGLEKQHQPGFMRKSLHHVIIDWKEKAKANGGPSFYSYDDEITVNTQAGLFILFEMRLILVLTCPQEANGTV